MRTASPRQRVVAGLLMQGYDQKEIAQELGIKQRTVKMHLKRMYTIYNVSDRYVKRIRLIYLLSKESA